MSGEILVLVSIALSRNIVRISLSEWFDLTGTNLANTISRYFAHQLLTLRHHKLGCNYDV
jgi:hypothetical protein